MNYVDGLIIDAVGIILLARTSYNEYVFLSGVIASAFVFVILLVVGLYMCVRKGFKILLC